MKKLHSILFFAGSVLLLSSCKKEITTYLETSSNVGKANLKVIHASAYTVINDSVQLKINNARVSNNLKYTTPFPGGGLNTGGNSLPFYMAITPGATKIGLAIPKAKTSLDSIALYSTTINLAADKYYSAYITDTTINTQIVVVEDQVSTVPDGVSKFKFINLIPNQAAVDVYFADVLIASNIAYKAISPEFTLANKQEGRWAIRPAGAATSTTPIAIYPATSAAAQVIPNKRILTVFSRGYSGATGNRAPAISLVYNIQAQ